MSAPVLRRARPWLGTLVDMRVEGLTQVRAQAAIEYAFAEVAAVHKLMSFHEPGGDLDRLHHARPGTRVRVAPRTREVLETALRVAAASGGRFDPTVACQQVACGRLPRPASSWQADALATWRDIELDGACGVRLARPLWIDLGGIAKGYAVDRAIEVLVDAGAVQACVNAGGDLRVCGEQVEVVHLRTFDGLTDSFTVELRDGAMATSAGGHDEPPTRRPMPIDGRWRGVAMSRIASVAAPSCMIADALTKVVLAGDDAVAQSVLDAFGAQARLLSRAGSAPIGVAA